LNILITGGSGFLGSAVARALQVEGHQVHLLTRVSSRITRLEDIKHLFQVRRYEKNESISQAIAGVNIDIVINTACSYGRSGETGPELLEANLLLGAEILQILSTRSELATFVNIGTSLPPGASLYALSKHLFSLWGELMTQNRLNNIQFINILLQKTYGPQDDCSRFPNSLIHACLKGDPIFRLTDCQEKRDFLYIDDAVRAILVVVKERALLAKTETIEVGTGSAIKVLSFAKSIHELTKSETRLIFEATQKRQDGALNLCANIEPLKSLGWYPKISLRCGIEKTIAGIKESLNSKKILK
jgi:CDP-paratose synthetase